MPGLDHAVHISTKRDPATHRYGCHNKPRDRPPMIVKDGFEEIGLNAGRLRFVAVKDGASVECRYDLSLKDPCCAGCAHQGSGEAYDAMIRSKGK